MSITTEIDSEKELIRHTCAGRLEMTDFIRAFDKAIELPGFKPGMSVLWDVRETRVSAPPQDMQALVTHVALSRQGRGTNYRLALVADDAMQKMLADIFKALASPLSFEVSIFKEMNEAETWLLATH